MPTPSSTPSCSLVLLLTLACACVYPTLDGTKGTSDDADKGDATAGSATADPGQTTAPPEEDCVGGPPPRPGGTLSCFLGVCDCPPGEKCIPYFEPNDAYSTKCVPIIGDRGYDEPCERDWSWTLEDNCAKDLFCTASFLWVSNEPLTCRQLCDGRDPGSCAIKGLPEAECYTHGDPALGICEIRCDPLDPDCPGEQACHPAFDRFWCRHTVEDASKEGDVCWLSRDCRPALTCYRGRDDDADALSPGHCVPYCDIEQGDAACTQGRTCYPFFDDPDYPPIDPAHARVGYCL